MRARFLFAMNRCRSTNPIGPAKVTGPCRLRRRRMASLRGPLSSVRAVTSPNRSTIALRMIQEWGEPLVSATIAGS